MAADPERRTTPVELFWDLVFVFAVTRVSTLLNAGLSWAGLGRGMLLLALVWWAWSAFAWATNAQDPDSPSFRVILLGASMLIFVAGLALPDAFGRYGLLFVTTYAGVRILHLVLYADASRRGNAAWSAIAGFSVTVAVGIGLLLAGALARGEARVALWTLAAAIDYAGPAWLTRERLRGLQRVAVAHFAERYGLFVLICLGESIVAIGIGAGVHRTLDAGEVLAVALSLLVTIGLWWIYFDRSAAEAEEHLGEHPDPVLAAADAYSYLHLLLVAGIIIFAVGARAVVVDVSAPLTVAGRLSLCGGVALFLAGHAAFQARLMDSPGRSRSRRALLAEPAAGAAVLLVVPISSGFAAWAATALIAGLLAALIGWQARMRLAREDQE